MKVIKPVALTTAMLNAASVPENDYAEWAAGTNYVAKQRVIRVATHRIYEAVRASSGKDPSTRADDSDWIDIGPTNRWAMFDQAVGSSTVAQGAITVTLAPGSVGALAIADTNADTARVVVKVGGTVLYDRTLSTNASGGVIDDWYDYFFAPIGKLMTLIFYDLPLYPNASIEVTITGPDPNGPVSVGTLLTGSLTQLGSTEAGASIGILDFSRKETDDFGVTTVVERAWSKRMTAKAMIDTAAVDGIQRALAGVRATPCLWIGEDGYDSLAVYGFFKDFSIDLTVGIDPATGSGGTSYVSLTIEGLI